MKINPAIFKAYDIRGVYPTDINEENFVVIIKAIYTFFTQDIGKDNLKVILGRDMRLSSPPLFRIAKETLLNFGATVVDVGLVSTPTFYFAALKYGVDCGIQVSASHNPPQWNGLKLVKKVGKNLIKIAKNTGMARIKELSETEKFVKPSGAGTVRQISRAVKDEVDFAFNLLKLKPKNIKKLKVVADPANAMGIPYLEELFKRLPCKLIKMNFTLNGRFPVHQPDPLDFKNLIDLEKKVVEEKADLGIAPDGDGDRVFFINEKGKVIPASHISALIAGKLLKAHKGDKIGIDIRYTRNIVNAVKKAGGVHIISHVGHALITELMNKEDILFTGESSGHYFYRETGYAESSVITILKILEIISREDKPISEIVGRYVTSIESGETNYLLPETIQAKDLLDHIAAVYKNGEISWLDGLAVDYPDWRFNIRTSNTEPLLRLNVEGDNADLVKQKEKELKQMIFKSGARVKK